MSGRRLRAVTDPDRIRQVAEDGGMVVELGRAKSAAARRWGQQQLVSKRVFAELMDVSEKTVERWAKRGMPAEKWGTARNSPVKIPLLRAQNWVREHAQTHH